MSRLALAKLVAAPEQWDRRKLQVLVVIGVLAAAAIITGIVWSILTAFADTGTDIGQTTPTSASGHRVHQSAPVSAGAAQPGPLSTATAGTISLPPAATLGPAQVATGFPHTRPGALAQLIAIDQRALQSVSVVTAQDVIAVWVLPGGPSPHNWSDVEALTVLLSDAGLPANGANELQLDLRPAMGLLPAASAHDVVPCADFVLTVTAGAAPANRIAVADCQRMVWHTDRWLIGPGPEPVGSPSLWPGTQASYNAGYQWLETSP